MLLDKQSDLHAGHFDRPFIIQVLSRMFTLGWSFYASFLIAICKGVCLSNLLQHLKYLN